MNELLGYLPLVPSLPRPKSQPYYHNIGMCDICLDNVKKYEDFCLLECGHWFCYNCLSKQTKSECILSCALCGADIKIKISYTIRDTYSRDINRYYRGRHKLASERNKKYRNKIAKKIKDEQYNDNQLDDVIYDFKTILTDIDGNKSTKKYYDELYYFGIGMQRRIRLFKLNDKIEIQIHREQADKTKHLQEFNGLPQHKPKKFKIIEEIDQYIRHYDRPGAWQKRKNDKHRKNKIKNRKVETENDYNKLQQQIHYNMLVDMANDGYDISNYNDVIMTKDNEKMDE